MCHNRSKMGLSHKEGPPTWRCKKSPSRSVHNLWLRLGAAGVSATVEKHLGIPRKLIKLMPNERHAQKNVAAAKIDNAWHQNNHLDLAIWSWIHVLIPTFWLSFFFGLFLCEQCSQHSTAQHCSQRKRPKKKESQNVGISVVRGTLDSLLKVNSARRVGLTLEDLFRVNWASGPNCLPWKNGRLGPMAQLSAAQLSS